MCLKIFYFVLNNFGQVQYFSAINSIIVPGGNEEVAEVAAVDPYDFLEPVEILSKLPKNFFSQIVGFDLAFIKHNCIGFDSVLKSII